jgi:2,3-diaminopropionate biosynthesis protein SbnB
MRLIMADLEACIDVVRQAYLAYSVGACVNPPGLFLPFDDRPNSRIIALPAHLKAPWNTSGIKWIASYPDNISIGLPRASAILVLNGHENGFPFACLEGSVISAARTAASAVLAARCFVEAMRVGALGFIGTGLIASYVYRFLVETGWYVERVRLYDSNRSAAENFADRIRHENRHTAVDVDKDVSSTVGLSELVVCATTSAAPHISDPFLFNHNPIVLHISLRDIAPEILLRSYNVVDDREHVVRANTSAHLALKQSGSMTFISSTIADVIERPSIVDRTRPVIFSPFGLGVLDVALGRWVYERALAAGDCICIDNFFPELDLISKEPLNEEIGQSTFGTEREIKTVSD